MGGLSEADRHAHRRPPPGLEHPEKLGHRLSVSHNVLEDMDAKQPIEAAPGKWQACDVPHDVSAGTPRLEINADIADARHVPQTPGQGPPRRHFQQGGVPFGTGQARMRSQVEPQPAVARLGIAARTVTVP